MKRSTLWSNSRGVRVFSSGKIRKQSLKGSKPMQLADTGINSEGKKTYTGNSNLKASQNLAELLSYHFKASVPHSKLAQPFPCMPREYPRRFAKRFASAFATMVQEVPRKSKAGLPCDMIELYTRIPSPSL